MAGTDRHVTVERAHPTLTTTAVPSRDSRRTITPMHTRLLVRTVSAVLVIGGAGACATHPSPPPAEVTTTRPPATSGTTHPRTPTPGTPSPASVTGNQIRELLNNVAVLDRRPRPGGYDRDCGPGSACVFGPAWTDATTAPGSGNGCSTRDDVLSEQLQHVLHRPGSRCIVVSGTLSPDPYTAATIAFTKSNASAVQIDHIYPLAAAWDFGAHAWTPAQRAAFANDISTELLAVDGRANQSKSDKTPSQWLPDNTDYRCTYVLKYVTVAHTYQLPISAADHDTIADVAESC